MLGPMVNPAFPAYQMVGVFNLELARMYGYLYQNTDKKYTVLHALDGYDEISLTGPTKTISNSSESILQPEDFGVLPVKAEAIIGGDTVEDSAEIFLSILKGNGSESQNNVVCANAGLAIATARDLNPKEGFDLARESLQNGKALKALQSLQKLSVN
jgi:anthranilate phosphoribosyltransferase